MKLIKEYIFLQIKIKGKGYIFVVDLFLCKIMKENLMSISKM